jgi:hypothetical protein
MMLMIQKANICRVSTFLPGRRHRSGRPLHVVLHTGSDAHCLYPARKARKTAIPRPVAGLRLPNRLPTAMTAIAKIVQSG